LRHPRRRGRRRATKERVLAVPADGPADDQKKAGDIADDEWLLAVQPGDLLLVSLEEIRAKYDANTENWRYLLLCAFRDFLKESGVDVQLIDPVQKMIFEAADTAHRQRRKGKKGAPMRKEKLSLLSAAAAAATALNDRGHFESIEVAIKAVAKAGGLDWKKLRQFRDNLHRFTNEENSKGYNTIVAQMKNWQTADILEAIERIGCRYAVDSSGGFVK
jgi:hypothetical protein